MSHLIIKKCLKYKPIVLNEFIKKIKCIRLFIDFKHYDNLI